MEFSKLMPEEVLTHHLLYVMDISASVAA